MIENSELMGMLENKSGEFIAQYLAIAISVGKLFHIKISCYIYHNEAGQLCSN
jgi:hypothetical protein